MRPERLAAAVLALGLAVLAGSSRMARRQAGRPAADQRPLATRLTVGQGVFWGSLKAQDLNGRPASLSFLRGRRALIFFSCGCGRCREAGRFLSGPGRALFAGAQLVSIATVPTGFARKLSMQGVLPGCAFADARHTLADRFGVSACPRAFAVNSDGQLLAAATLGSNLDREAWGLAARFNARPAAVGGSAKRPTARGGPSRVSKSAETLRKD